MQPERLYFTDDDAANRLLAEEPLALLIGFALDQQVSVPVAFSGPLKMKQRLGTLDADAIAGLDPETLEAAFRDAADGRPSLAFVAGESGVGKSRMIAELATRAREDGARVAIGECVELGDEELPYAPIVSVLRSLARDHDPVLDELPPAARAELAALPVGADPPTAR